MERPLIRYVSDAELRYLFNESEYQAQLENGTLIASIVADRHPSTNKAGEITCTRSQIVAYTDMAGLIVARVHQYLRPDGTLGASGRPDPKFLLYEGTVYKQG